MLSLYRRSDFFMRIPRPSGASAGGWAVLAKERPNLKAFNAGEGEDTVHSQCSLDGEGR